MSHRRAKRIRKMFREQGIPIETGLMYRFERSGSRTILAKKGRRRYQAAKKKMKELRHAVRNTFI
jgi:hypothetical protein